MEMHFNGLPAHMRLSLLTKKKIDDLRDDMV